MVVDTEVEESIPLYQAFIWFIVGLFMLWFGSDWIISSSSNIARFFGLSDWLIGLTIVSIGTSLPEVAAAIAGVSKGKHDLAIGNIVGSNIFMMLVVCGSVFAMLAEPIDLSSLATDFVMMAVASLLFIFTVWWPEGDKKISRKEGALLTVSFCIYLTYVCMTR